MQQRRMFLAGMIGGAASVAAIGGVITYLLAANDVQHTTVNRFSPQMYVKVNGHPAVHRTILEARIDGWYHPLPWVGEKIHDVFCPLHLEAVVGAQETCTARTGDGRVSIPVHVVKVGGRATEPRVTWKFDR